MRGSEDTCCHCDVSNAAGGHSAGCRTSWVCLQHHAMWWHLMVLQYVAASFHLPSVSTANTNTVQHTKPHSNMKHQQSQLLWYPRCCFLSPTSWQPLFTAGVDTFLMSLQVCQHKEIWWTRFTGAFHTNISCSDTCLLCPNITTNSALYSVNAYRSYFLRSSNNCEKQHKTKQGVLFLHTWRKPMDLSGGRSCAILPLSLVFPYKCYG